MTEHAAKCSKGFITFSGYLILDVAIEGCAKVGTQINRHSFCFHFLKFLSAHVKIQMAYGTRTSLNYDSHLMHKEDNQSIRALKAKLYLRTYRYYYFVK